jgi:hypothetical protein
MPQPDDLSRSLVALDQDSMIIAVVRGELDLSDEVRTKGPRTKTPQLQRLSLGMPHRRQALRLRRTASRLRGLTALRSRAEGAAML